MALPRKFRFVSKRAVRFFLRQARWRHSPIGRIYFQELRTGETPHFLVVISKRIAPSSACRHLLKRRIEGWYVRAKSQPPHNVMIVLSTAAAGLNPKELKTIFTKTCDSLRENKR